MDLIGGPRVLDGDAATALLLGPLLRHVGEHDATIWLETDGRVRRPVRAGAVVAQTGRSGGRARLRDRRPRRASSRVRRRPTSPARRRARLAAAGSPFPPSRIRTLAPGGAGPAPLRLVPRARATSRHSGDRPRRAQRLRPRMASQAHEEWPDLIVMLGDQIYADDTSGDAASSSAPPQRPPAAARRGRRLRGVHRALLRVVGRSRGPLAPVRPCRAR